jgi:hypothetical protein
MVWCSVKAQELYALYNSSSLFERKNVAVSCWLLNVPTTVISRCRWRTSMRKDIDRMHLSPCLLAPVIYPQTMNQLSTVALLCAACHLSATLWTAQQRIPTQTGRLGAARAKRRLGSFPNTHAKQKTSYYPQKKYSVRTGSWKPVAPSEAVHGYYGVMNWGFTQPLLDPPRRTMALSPGFFLLFFIMTDSFQILPYARSKISFLISIEDIKKTPQFN